MNSEREKWIETWLDSASERAYQQAFITALMLNGYHVLHSTSHNSMEQGKDVIARDSSGCLVAFQLKGNPGGRFTMSGWKENFSQILQLVDVPCAVSYRKDSEELHKAVFVTNGFVAEDVRSTIETFNSSPNRKVKLEIWGRGELLRILSTGSGDIWPDRIDLQIKLLNFIIIDPDSEISISDINELFDSLISGGDSVSKARQVERVLRSIMAASIIAGRFIDKGNVFEVLKLYIVLYVKIIVVVESKQLSGKKIDSLISRMREEIILLLCELRKLFVELDGAPISTGNIFFEFPFYHQRKMMVYGLLSVLSLEELRVNGKLSDNSCYDFLKDQIDFPFLDGEYIIPYVLGFVWAADNLSAKRNSDALLISTVRALISANGNKVRDFHIPSPFYGLVDVVRWRNRILLGVRDSVIEEDNFYRVSWFARPLFYLLVRRNWKLTCKAIWPDLTRFTHKSSLLKDKKEFSNWRAKSAVDTALMCRIPQSWEDVVGDARKTGDIQVPQCLLDDHIMCLLYCLFVPFRMTPDLVLFLDRQFSRTWY